MRLVEHFFRIIAPHDCLVCNREGSLLCGACAYEYLEPLPDVCYRCNAFSPGSMVCKKCRPNTALQHVWSRAEYNKTAKALVYELKFNFARDAASVIAKEMTTVLPVFGEDTVLVHVPAASSRVRQRGYDQSAIIARELLRATKLAHIHALRRIGQQRQVGSDSQLRRTQMQGAYRVLSPESIKGAHIILVDDVLTTGSTLEAAAAALKQAGAKQIDAVTFARANQALINRDKLV